MGRNEFEYCASAKVYCKYYRMVLKLEEYTGIFKAIYTGMYFLFLFYHSCGNDIGREDGLNVMMMKSKYIGAQ